MAYNADVTGNHVAPERVIRKIDDRTGSFVIQHTGTFDGKSVKDRWFIVPGSGTGDLQGLIGGEFEISGHGLPHQFRVRTLAISDDTIL
jgi:hypothetical protein